MRVAVDTNRLTDLFRGAMKSFFSAFSAVPQPAFCQAEHYARLFIQLKRAGTPVPDNDRWCGLPPKRWNTV
jgi:hypothetical protein